MRSLLVLEDELPRRPRALDGFAFVEIGVDADSAPDTEALLRAMGFAHVGPHRTKPVQLWEHGDIRVVLNHGAGDTTRRSSPSRSRARDPDAQRRARRGAARPAARAPPRRRRGRPHRGRGARRHRGLLLRHATGSRLPRTGETGGEPACRSSASTTSRSRSRSRRSTRPASSTARCSTCEPSESQELAAPDGLVRSRALATGDGACGSCSTSRRSPAPPPGRAPARRVRLRRRAGDGARDARARRRRCCASPATTTTTWPRGSSSTPSPRAARARRALRPRRPRRRAPALLHGPRRRARVLRGARAPRRLRRLRRRQLTRAHGRAADGRAPVS